MTGTPQVTLHVSPELFGRMKLRAAEQRHGVDEWVLRTVIGELLRMENEDVRRAHETLAARSSLPCARPSTEREIHAPHS